MYSPFSAGFSEFLLRVLLFRVIFSVDSPAALGLIDIELRTRDCWVLGLCLSCVILKKHKVSETGLFPSSGEDGDTPLGLLENANISHCLAVLTGPAECVSPLDPTWRRKQIQFPEPCVFEDTRQ
jgi:hypothetical protein